MSSSDVVERSEVEDAIVFDDRPRFVSAVNSILKTKLNVTEEQWFAFVTDPMKCPRIIYQWIVDNNALNCASALLEGEARLLNDLGTRIRYGRTPLIEAATRFSYEMVYLFILHGAEMDEVAKDECTDLFLSPLEYALQSFIFGSHLQLCSTEESIFKLVIIFCLPHLRGALETIRVLAWATIDVNKFFYNYATNGNLIEMVPLLMVAAERATAPIDLHDISSYYGIVTVREGIKKEIGSLDDELMESSILKRDDFVQTCKRKETLNSALLLLDLFERAGDTIVSYLQSHPLQSNMSIGTVVEEVATILKKAGFVLKEEDTDLSNISSKYNEMKAPEGSSRAHKLWCELKEPKGSPEYRLWCDLNLLNDRSPNILWNAKRKLRNFQVFKQLQQKRIFYPPYHRGYFQGWLSYFGKRYNSSMSEKLVKAHFKGDTRATKRCILPSQSSCLRASLALSCKRWMKYI